MKLHSTNYINTFIEIADDCPASYGQIPPLREKEKTIARIQYELICNNPYQLNSDDVLFAVYCERNNIHCIDLEELKTTFFSKGQPCFRSSPLTKRYGWGVHCDSNAKMAIYGAETQQYNDFVNSKSLLIVKGMNSKRRI